MSRSISWTAFLLMAAFSLLASPAYGRQPGETGFADLAGKYTLSEGGYVVISVDDRGRVNGFYERKGEFGRLSGTAESGVFAAKWVQRNGSAACEATVDGSSHWGRVTIAPRETGELDLAWGECRSATTQFETAR